MSLSLYKYSTNYCPVSAASSLCVVGSPLNGRFSPSKITHNYTTDPLSFFLLALSMKEPYRFLLALFTASF